MRPPRTPLELLQHLAQGGRVHIHEIDTDLRPVRRVLINLRHQKSVSIRDVDLLVIHGYASARAFEGGRRGFWLEITTKGRERARQKSVTHKGGVSIIDGHNKKYGGNHEDR